MSSLSPLYRRRSLRLQGYDYSQDGAYFVTICTAERRCHFGQIADHVLRLNAIGEAVRRHWAGLPNHHKGVDLDSFVVMPNHVHGIIIFTQFDGGDDDHRAREGEAGLATTARGDTHWPEGEAGLATTIHQDTRQRGEAGAGDQPTPEGEAGLATTDDGGVAPERRKRTLGVVVAGFKSAVSREARLHHKISGAPLWQSGYYEHVVRSEAALDRIREYIENNPAKWAFDHDNPANWRTS